jgi:hypothetical protein
MAKINYLKRWNKLTEEEKIDFFDRFMVMLNKRNMGFELTGALGSIKLFGLDKVYPLAEMKTILEDVLQKDGWITIEEEAK